MNRIYQESFWLLWAGILGALAIFGFVVVPALKQLAEHALNIFPR